MSTMLTDAERPTLAEPHTEIAIDDPMYGIASTALYTAGQLLEYAQRHEAAVLTKLAQQVSVAGVVRCEFDDECDFCKSPQGGSFTRLIHNPEDVTEAEFYICGDCLHQAVTNYTRPDSQQADRQRVSDGHAGHLAKELVRLADIHRDCGRLVSKDGAAERVMREAAAMLAAATEAPAQAEHHGLLRHLRDQVKHMLDDLILCRVEEDSGLCRYESLNDLRFSNMVEALQRLMPVVDAALVAPEAPAQASEADERATPAVTGFNVGRWCLSEDDCIEQGIDFAAYERGVADAAAAFGQARAALAQKGGAA